MLADQDFLTWAGKMQDTSCVTSPAATEAYGHGITASADAVKAKDVRPVVNPIARDQSYPARSQADYDVQLRDLRPRPARAYSRPVREIPVEQVPEDVAEAVRAAARGEIVFLTEDGERLAAIVPPGYAVELEDLAPDEVLALLDEMAADQPEP